MASTSKSSAISGTKSNLLSLQLSTKTIPNSSASDKRKGICKFYKINKNWAAKIYSTLIKQATTKTFITKQYRTHVTAHHLSKFRGKNRLSTYLPHKSNQVIALSCPRHKMKQNRLTPSNEAQIYIQECKLRHIHTTANTHCITCYHDVCCSIKYYTFQGPCEFSTNQLKLSTTGSDSVNGVSQPRTRKQDTHYAITTQADVFTNTRNARYYLGTEHGWSFELLEQ
jgi:hypothetical protein